MVIKSLRLDIDKDPLVTEIILDSEKMANRYHRMIIMVTKIKAKLIISPKIS